METNSKKKRILYRFRMSIRACDAFLALLLAHVAHQDMALRAASKQETKTTITCEIA